MKTIDLIGDYCQVWFMNLIFIALNQFFNGRVFANVIVYILLH